MKKSLSILLAALILLSGMHLSVASHICGGRITETKISFSEQTAQCGMEDESMECPIEKSVASNCCKNAVDVYAVDGSYSRASFQFDVLNQQIPIYYIPEAKPVWAYYLLPASSYYDAPPERIAISEVLQPDICVFRN